MLFKVLPDRQGITLFPIVRFAGIPVSPYGWSGDSAEPILLCSMGLEQLTGRTVEEVNKQKESLVKAGWDWSARDEGKARIHVDALEKIEGPPPEGSF